MEESFVLLSVFIRLRMWHVIRSIRRGAARTPPKRNKWRRPPSLYLHQVQVCRGYMLSSSARVGIRCGARALFLFQSAFLEEHSRLDLVERMGRCAGI